MSLILLFVPVVPDLQAEKHQQQTGEEFRAPFSIKNLPDGWEVYYSQDQAPDQAKPIFNKKKKPGDNPRFVAQKIGNAVFAMGRRERVDYDFEEYVTDLQTSLQMRREGMEILHKEVNNDRAALLYRMETNGIPFLFYDLLIPMEQDVARLVIWGLESYMMANPDAASALTASVDVSGVDRTPAFLATLEQVQDQATAQRSPSAAKDDSSHPGAIFYTATKGDTTVYLLGSIHLGKPDFYPFHSRIEQAFQESDALVLEIDMRPEKLKEYRSVMMEKLRLPEGKTLRDVVSPAFYEQLSSAFEGYRLKIDRFEQFRPWVVVTTIRQLKYLSMGYSADFGVENYFIRNLEDHQVIELENIEDQLDMLQSISTEEQLTANAVDWKMEESSLHQITEHWQAGDASALEEMLIEAREFQTKEGEQILKRFLFDRNELMVDRLLEILDQEETKQPFVVVGAAHIVGDMGLPALLKKKGFTIEHFQGSDTNETSE